MTLIEKIQGADNLSKGLFVAASGLVMVFLVLTLFYAAIKLLQRLDRKKES